MTMCFPTGKPESGDMAKNSLQAWLDCGSSPESSSCFQMRAGCALCRATALQHQTPRSKVRRPTEPWKIRLVQLHKSIPRHLAWTRFLSLVKKTFGGLNKKAVIQCWHDPEPLTLYFY